MIENGQKYDVLGNVTDSLSLNSKYLTQEELMLIVFPYLAPQQNIEAISRTFLCLKQRLGGITL